MNTIDNAFFQPVSAMELARFAGVPTFMRLPSLTPDHPRFSEVQMGLVGVPWDGGTTNRPGARHGPLQNLTHLTANLETLDGSSGNT